MEAARIINGILKGIAYTHKKGIIHRDIKTSKLMNFTPNILKVNILLGSKKDYNKVKIIDYGLATKID